MFSCVRLYIVVFSEAACLLINSTHCLLFKSGSERDTIRSAICSLITKGQAMLCFSVCWINVRSVFGPSNYGQFVETCNGGENMPGYASAQIQCVYCSNKLSITFFFWLLAWSDFICGDWVFHRQSWNLLELFLLGNMFVISNVNIDPISINKPNMMFFLNIISFVGDCRP